MPKPSVSFVVPPTTLQFTNGIPRTVSLEINPLSDHPFHVIFTLNYAPTYFIVPSGGHPKTFEVFPVNPDEPYSSSVYDFDLTIGNDSGEDAYTDLHVVVISNSGKSIEDNISIIVQ